LAAATGWGFREIMEDVPLAGGLQIIDAECLKNGTFRFRESEPQPDFDSRQIVDEAFKKLRQNHGARNYN
jgi:hypothetical protein